MAYTIQKPNESLEDQAVPSTVWTPKSHSVIIGGEPTRMSSSRPHHEAALHSKNDLTMPILDRNQQPVIADGSVDISGYSEGNAGTYKTPSEIFQRGAENPNSYTTLSSHTEARRSSVNVTASENLNASFQLPTLDKLPKHSDNFRLGNNFGSTKSDTLEHRDRVLGLESSSLCRDNGQWTPDDKHLSKSLPVSEDVGTLQERIQILQQNCERTMQQLFQKEEENSKLKNEVTKHSEMELRLKRECERLRTHLVETEDRYTREALEAEEREEQLRKSLAVLKEQMISSSTDVLNAKSSAMKQVDSLRSQLNSVMEERDDGLLKLADADETISSYSSSLANLQLVLEEFQDERQSHQMVELDKCRRDLEKERLISQQLREKTDAMQVKIDELSSAPATVKQLQQQLTENERQMAELQDEVQAQKTELLQTKANLQRFSAVSEDKIDRPLVKNLLMGFIHTPPAKRDEAFRVVGHILGFTDDELKEIGVNSSGSWISGLSHRISSSAVHLGSDGRSKMMDRSFSELFVQFLEKESSPLPSAKLPAERMAQEQQDKLHRSSSSSFDGPLTPPPLLPPLSNQFSTSTNSQSMPAFQMHQSTYLSVSEEQQTVTTSTYTETQRTEIPIDQSASGSHS